MSSTLSFRSSPDLAPAPANRRSVRFAPSAASPPSSPPEIGGAHTFGEPAAFSEHPASTLSSDIEVSTLLAIASAKGRLGCAVFTPETSSLHLLEDCPDVGVLAEEDARSESRLQDVTSTLPALGGRLEIRSARDFSFASGCHHLQALLGHLGEAHDDLPGLRDALHLSGAINVESMPLSVGAAGAIVSHLNKMLASLDERDDGAATLVSNIEAASLDGCMLINADARSSLNVFDIEGHATLYSSATKEGLSLFCARANAGVVTVSALTVLRPLSALFNQLRSSMSPPLLRRWLLFPSTSLEVIQERHEAVECLLLPANAHAVKQIDSHLKDVKTIPTLMARLRRSGLELAGWKTLHKFCVSVELLRTEVSLLRGRRSAGIFSQLLASFSHEAFGRVKQLIEKTLDWEQSAAEGRLIVMPGLDEELDKNKETYAALPSLLSSVAGRIATELLEDGAVDEAWARLLHVVFFPQIGFLVSISDAGDEALRGPAMAVGWRFAFQTDENSFWKSSHADDLDVHLGDLSSIITDREIEIMDSMQQEVLSSAALLIRASVLCAELDCLRAFALAAALYDYVRPEMVDGQVLHIEGGRHPLQELCVKSFVPNDTLLGAGTGEPRVLILTGANACGKSVYLKQVALIQLMAQIGSFVPAAAARLGVVDAILTRVQGQESVTRPQSSFAIDMSQLSFALRNCTQRSLVLLDELGKGTSAADGAAIFAATIRHLIELGDDCPIALATTHFHEVLTDAFLPTALPYLPAHMEMLVTRGEEETEMTFLYRIKAGFAQHSHAAHCARLCGIPDDVVDRAEEVLELSRSRHPSIFELALAPHQEVDIQRAELCAREFLSWELDDEDGARDAGPSDVRAALRRLLDDDEASD